MRSRFTPAQARPRAFTLIELLVVIAILDGHAELRKWLEKPRAGRAGLDGKVTDYSRLDDGRFANNRDIWWLASRTTTAKNGQDPF